MGLFHTFLGMKKIAVFSWWFEIWYPWHRGEQTCRTEEGVEKEKKGHLCVHLWHGQCHFRGTPPPGLTVTFSFFFFPRGRGRSGRCASVNFSQSERRFWDPDVSCEPDAAFYQPPLPGGAWNPPGFCWHTVNMAEVLLGLPIYYSVGDFCLSPFHIHVLVPLYLYSDSPGGPAREARIDQSF